MHDRPRRVLAYVRVSSQAQGDHGTSLDAQQEEIKRFCKASAYPDPVVFVEVESGGEKAERRVEQVKLMASVCAGDLVVATKIDRWSRFALYFLQSSQEIMSRGAKFLSLAERFDPSTPEGQYAATIMAATAQMEHRRIFERTVGNRRRLRDMGKSVEGQCPFGYRRQSKTLVIYEPEAKLVRRAYALCIQGLSLTSLRAQLATEGLRRDKQVIHKYLRDRIYLGEMRDTRGVWHATHAAIVTPAEYEAAQSALASRQLGGRRAERASATSRWLLRGLAVCARCGRRCGGAYSPRTRHDPLDGYYACQGRLRYRSCDSGRAPVRPTDKRARDMSWTRLVELRHDLAHFDAGEIAPRVESRHASERAALVMKRKRVVDLAAAGVITLEDVRSRTSKIDAELRALDALEEAERRQRETEEQLRNPQERRALLADIRTLAEAWRKMPVESQREALSILAERVELDGEHLKMHWRETSDLMGGKQPAAEYYRRQQLRDLAKKRRIA